MAAPSGSSATRHSTRATLSTSTPTASRPSTASSTAARSAARCEQDKTFFFTAVERFSQERTSFVNLLSDPNIFQPTASQNALFNFLSGVPPFAPLAAGLRAR